jgi:Flp pilus assembly protein TadD
VLLVGTIAVGATGVPAQAPGTIDTLLRAERWVEAEAALVEHLEAMPDDADGWMLLGLAHRHQGEDADAIAAYERAVALDDTSLPALIGIALVYDERGDRDMAFAWLERAVDAGLTAQALASNPIYDPLREDSRFATLMQDASAADDR